MKPTVRQTTTQRILGNFHAQVGALQAHAANQDRKAERASSAQAKLWDLYHRFDSWLVRKCAALDDLSAASRERALAEAQEAREASRRIQKFLAGGAE